MPGPIPGLSLADIATGSMAETQARQAGGADLMAAAVAMAQEQQEGQLGSAQAAQFQDQTFARAQAILAEALVQREQAMRVAEHQARLRFEEEQAARQRAFLASEGDLNRSHDRTLAQIANSSRGGGGGGGGGGSAEPDWFTMQRFQTDENIRQARAIAAMERASEAVRDKQSRTRLSDYGSQAAHPDRGRLLVENRNRRIQAGEKRDFTGRTRTAPYRLPERTMERVNELIDQHTTTGGDFFTLTQLFRRELGPDLASIALFELGLMPPA